MTALRRTKNYASDPQTPMFLYTILKQLDLRSIDWSIVANSLDISNGHAARMRYSRMKTQFEGTTQPRNPRPKKDKGSQKTNDKPNGKRALLEEEEERLANHKRRTEVQEQRYEPDKRLKLDPQQHIGDWNRGFSANEQYSYPSWSQRAIIPDPPFTTYPSMNSANLQTSPMVRSSVFGAVDAAAVPVIKQEPWHEAMDLGNVGSKPTEIKKEPGTVSATPATLQHTSYSPTTGGSSTTIVTSSPSIKHAPPATPQSTTYNSSDNLRTPRFRNPWISRPSVHSQQRPQYFVPSYPNYASYAMPASHQRVYTNAGDMSRNPSVASNNVFPFNSHATSYTDLLNSPLYKTPTRSNGVIPRAAVQSHVTMNQVSPQQSPRGTPPLLTAHQQESVADITGVNEMAPNVPTTVSLARSFGPLHAITPDALVPTPAIVNAVTSPVVKKEQRLDPPDASGIQDTKAEGDADAEGELDTDRFCAVFIKNAQETANTNLKTNPDTDPDTNSSSNNPACKPQLGLATITPTKTSRKSLKQQQRTPRTCSP
jgi:hypothetical protein